MPCWLNGDQRSLRKISLCQAKRIEDLRKPNFGQNVLYPQLHDARALRSGSRENGAKVQVVSEKYVTVGSAPAKHFPVARVRGTDIPPVNRLYARGPKLPATDSVHNELHSPTRVSSRSPARHAA